MKRYCARAEEMARCLRALDALLEDLGTIPSIHVAGNNLLSSISRESDVFF